MDMEYIYSDDEFDYFRTVIKTPRKVIGGTSQQKSPIQLAFPTEKVQPTDSCLIIEDDLEQAALVKEGLILFGFSEKNIFVENTGDQGLQTFLTNSSIKLLVIDIHIPEMNGLEIVKAIRTNHMYAQVHLILFSAGISKNIVQYAAAYKTSVLSKPYNQERFNKWLESICIPFNPTISSSSTSQLPLEKRVQLLEEKLEKVVAELSLYKKHYPIPQ